MDMFSIFLIPFFSKDVGPNIPIKSTSCLSVEKAVANDFILVQGAPGMGLGSSKKNDILSGLTILSHSKFRYNSSR